MVSTRKEQLATTGGSNGDTIEISAGDFIFAPNTGGSGAGSINEITDSSSDGYIENFSPTGGFDENALENLVEFDGYFGGTTITGIAAPSKSIKISIVNVSSGDLTFLAEDDSSTDANQIRIGGGVTSLVLETDDVATFIYSTSVNRWRVT